MAKAPKWWLFAAPSQPGVALYFPSTVSGTHGAIVVKTAHDLGTDANTNPGTNPSAEKGTDASTNPGDST